MSSASEEDQKAKMGFINAFFDNLDNKANYLIALYNDGRRDEARILCSCYLDGLTSALCWPDERSNYCYVKTLQEHGGNDIFSHIHPRMLDEALNKLAKRGDKWKAIHETASEKLKSVEKRLYEESEVIEIITPLLSMAEIALVSKELWRGSFAAIVYERFRVAAAHGFGPPDGTTFDGTTFQGKPVPQIDFFMVHGCLKRIASFARTISEKSGKWFGHDYK